MRSIVRFRLVALCVAFFVAVFATAQQSAPPAGPPQPGARQGGPRGPRPAPVNLKVLPKTMSGDDVIKLMHQYEGDLGVECEFCHAQNAETHRLDFPSDAKPMKDRARVMITMTDDLNAKYLAELPGGHKDSVTCGTCHQGHSRPVAFVPAPRERPAGGPPAGAALPGAPK